MTKDILLYENGSGGEMKVMNNDLVLSETLYNQIYLALFGGNVEASTKGNELTNEERFDYWANQLFHRQRKGRQFNSITEKTLFNIVLNSSGRNEILRAIQKDLSFLNSIVDNEITVSIISKNRVEISIIMRKLSNLEDKTLQIIWDNSINEVIIKEII